MIDLHRTTHFATVLVFAVATAIAAQSAKVAVIGAPAAGGAPSSLAIEMQPALDIPLVASADYFTLGGAVDLNITYHFSNSPFSLLGGAEYCYTPTQGPKSLSLSAARFGAGVNLPMASFLSLYANVFGGIYFATFNDLSLSAVNPYLAGGIGLQFQLGTHFALTAGAQYKSYLLLWQGLSAGIGASIILGKGSASATPGKGATPSGSPKIEFLSTFAPAFPVFYKYYDEHPIGMLHINNLLGVPISNVKVQFYVKQYMDEPKEVVLPGQLAAGSGADIGILALFTDSILNITEGTKAAASLVISYDANGQSYEEKKIETVSFLGRNAMTWDDNRKAAAYVTAKDPAVLQFARSVTSKIRQSETRSIDENLQAAIALHEALDLYGLDYVPNPITPYSQASAKKDVIDFLQFPRETFRYKAGDCSDISILYSSLLQAVGIDTAFVTIPGHIFVAVSTALSPEQASDALIPASEFIAYKGKVWIPVEITMRHRGFLKAWELGAKEWNENNPRGQAGFYPIQDAWIAYQPVGLPGASSDVQPPSTDQVMSAYKEEATRYVDSAIGPKIAELQAEIQKPDNVSAINRLGVIYARFGQPDNAEAQFRAALAVREYLPAILNLGNLYFIREDWQKSLAYYQRALIKDPNSCHVLLAIAKTDQQLGKTDDMMQKYNQVKKIDPGLAEQFAYLSGGAETGSRATDVGTERSAVIWEVE